MYAQLLHACVVQSFLSLLARDQRQKMLRCQSQLPSLHDSHLMQKTAVRPTHTWVICRDSWLPRRMVMRSLNRTLSATSRLAVSTEWYLGTHSTHHHRARGKCRVQHDQ